MVFDANSDCHRRKVTRVPKIRLDLLIVAVLAELLWMYCFLSWTSQVIFEATVQPWHFSLFWDYYVVAFIFFLFTFCEYLIAYIAYAGIKGRTLIPFTINV